MATQHEAIWGELRRLDQRQHDLVTDQTRMQGEADEVCSRVERLEAGMANVATKADLNHAEQMVSQKIDHLKDTFDPLKKGLYALVWLIISVVVLGGLAFLIEKPGP